MEFIEIRREISFSNVEVEKAFKFCDDLYIKIDNCDHKNCVNLMFNSLATIDCNAKVLPIELESIEYKVIP